jgi:hypothetical protein
MSTMPSVIVRKGGFLSALAHGFFTFLTVTTVSGMGIAAYMIWVADANIQRVMDAVQGAASILPEWRTKFPPALVDALCDRRDPAYREQLDVRVRLVGGAGLEGTRAVVEVSNKGSQTVSALALRIVVSDENQVPRHELVSYAATPVALDKEEWRGPLLPHETRRFSREIGRAAAGWNASSEIAELRVWVGEEPRAGG